MPKLPGHSREQARAAELARAPWGTRWGAWLGGAFAVLAALMTLGISGTAMAADLVFAERVFFHGGDLALVGGLAVDLVGDLGGDLVGDLAQALATDLAATLSVGLTPIMVDAGIGGLQQGCAGTLSGLLEVDSMLFSPESSARGGGFRAFDFAFLAVVALVVISAIRFRHATTGRRLELARRMVEKGIEPPPELIGAHNGSDLRRGLVLVFTGTGLLLASWLGGGGHLSPAGLIPGFIGLGYLVSHRFAIRSGGRANGGGQ
jgi:hypothetical protein